MSKTEKKRVVILGAGPTGLGAAWRLNELNHDDWVLLERDSKPGGLASSIVDDKGFVWDLGGHVLFSHYEYFDEVLDGCMDGDWVKHEREAWVWLRNQFIPYPFQNNIWRLPAPDLVQCLEGLLSVHNKPAIPLRSDNFEDWIFRNFGKGLAEVFFLPYNFKVWAYPPRSMSSCWIQERVATVDLSKILRNLVLREDELGWGPNSTFRFPLRGGTGEIWRRLYERLPQNKIRTGSKVISVSSKEKKVYLEDGSIIEFDILISSLPLSSLLQMLDIPELQVHTDKFRYSNTNLIGIGMEGQPPEVLKTKCWMYFVEDKFPFYRITVFSNYSKFNVPEPGKQWSLLCEISESPEKPVNQANLKAQTLQALRDIKLIEPDSKVISMWQHRLEFGYPTPFLERDQIIDQIDKRLLKESIFSRGRFGAWKYEVSNQDHSFMQGVEAIDHIMFAAEEMTYHYPAVVNSSKRTTRRILNP